MRCPLATKVTSGQFREEEDVDRVIQMIKLEGEVRERFVKRCESIAKMNLLHGRKGEKEKGAMSVCCLINVRVIHNARVIWIAAHRLQQRRPRAAHRPPGNRAS